MQKASPRGFADLAGLNGLYRLKSESFQLWMAAKGTAVEGLEPSRLRPHVTIVIDAGFAPRGPRLGSAFRHTPGLLRLGAGYPSPQGRRHVTLVEE